MCRRPSSESSAAGATTSCMCRESTLSCLRWRSWPPSEPESRPWCVSTREATPVVFGRRYGSLSGGRCARFFGDRVFSSSSCAYEVEQFSRRLRIDPQTIRLIRNGSEPLPVDDSPPLASGSPLISSVGRLERYKGHHRLIAAMPALLEMAPNARLAIVGRGPYEKNLRRLVTRLGVEHAVMFISFGSSERAALGALVRSSDIVALLSDYEANPVAVMEAFALGRKVIVAATSGLTELATEGLATAVPPTIPPTELARVLVAMAAAPEPTSPALPTWDHCVDQFLLVYAETVQN